jgi:membrane-bound ClpP family serine protease
MVKKVLIVFSIVIFVGGGIFIYWLRNQTNTEITSYLVSGIPVLEIKGPIDGNGARKINEALLKIEKSDATSYILLIDTSGGEVHAGLRISERLLESEVKVYGLVKEAVALGIYIVSSTDEIIFLIDGIAGAIVRNGEVYKEVGDLLFLNAEKALDLNYSTQTVASVVELALQISKK